MNPPKPEGLFDVLVAEDEPVTRKRLAGILTGLGHRVRVFADGRSAWESFDRLPTRIVISDWQMPQMDGPELCRKVRARANTGYTYFILVTGEHTAERDYEDAVSAGTDDFLTKPITRDGIWRRLRVANRMLGYSKHIRALEQLIPMCAYCKDVRADADYWKSLEEYIHSQTGSTFTHGICPDCFGRVVEELDAMEA